MPGPTFIEGDTITLRTIEETDLEFLQTHVNDPVVWRPIGRSLPLNAAQEQEFFENVVCDDSSVNLLIAVDSSPVGAIGLDGINWQARKAELGYWIAPESHAQGYGTEAAELLVAHGFDQLGLHRIAARVFAFNEPSRRLLESVGFTREGITRESVFIDGEYHDTYRYGLLEDEWRSQTA